MRSGATAVPVRSRFLVVVASLLLLGVFAFPLWRVDLTAPQYPEGLGMTIHINTVRGLTEFDLARINSLNHYIGMKAIDADAIPELRVMPWIVGALLVGGLAVAAIGRRALLAAWVGGFALLGVAGLVDFVRWEYDYGHNLDPDAIITIPGMSFQPPLIGVKTLANFTASSWPAPGGWIAGLSFGLAVAALVIAFRHRPATASPRDAVAEANQPQLAGSA